MTAPTPYDRIFSFTNFQAANPTSPPPGNELDAEYNAVKVTTDALISNLGLIQRSDGQVANQSVGPQQLKPGLLAGINPPTQWSGSSVSYDVNDTVFSGLLFYVCNTAHVSSVAAPPSDNADWTLLADFSGVTIPPGSITSAAFAPGAVNSAALGSGLSLPASPTDGDDSTAIATTHFVKDAVAGSGPPAGLVAMFAGASAPIGWFICNGQAVSRTGNPNLFTAIGTTYGAGDGSTTFNVPNYSGKTPVALGGSDSITLNESFGSSTVTLNVANLAAHNHTDSGHAHSATPTPHSHSATDSGHAHSYFETIAGGVGASLSGGVQGSFSSQATGVGAANITVAPASAAVTIAAGAANIGNTGSGAPFGIYQPSVGVNFIIRGG